MKLSFMILTGGKSSRYGSDKSQIIFEGQALIIRILGELPQGNIVIVGPSFEQDVREVTFAQEDPLGGGPVAAIAAGLQRIASEEVVILATDMPFAGQIIPNLVTRSDDWEALIPLDSQGKRQPLCAKYKSAALFRAFAELGEPSGKSLNSLLDRLKIEEMTVEPNLASKLVDIDTREDLLKILDSFEREIEEI